MNPRANKELADRYFADDTLKAWYWPPGDGGWVFVSNPWFSDDLNWHVGHEAPTEPPAKMCELAGVKFPMPMTEAPEADSQFWVVTIDGANYFRWQGSLTDLSLLNQRRCHRTKESAEQHYRALVAANMQAVEAAK